MLQRAFLFFFFNDTPTPEIYTLSLHDALPISCVVEGHLLQSCEKDLFGPGRGLQNLSRSEEHTSELQSRPHLVCRLLLEKKKIADRSEFHCNFTTHTHDQTRMRQLSILTVTPS